MPSWASQKPKKRNEYRKGISFDGLCTAKAVYGRFDPDYNMAVAWKRLREGKFEDRDITLLCHELIESQMEKRYNLTAAEAHKKATEKYDWWGQLVKELGEEGEKDGLL